MGEVADNQRLSMAALHAQIRGDPATVFACLCACEARMSLLELDCANNTRYMTKLLYLYVAIQAAVLTTLISALQPTEGCEIWMWFPLILSGLASTAMTALFLQYHVQQFNLHNNGRQLQENRDFLVRLLLQNWRILFLSAYGWRTVFQEATNCWWIAQRVASLLMFIAFSIFLILSCTRLLC